MARQKGNALCHTYTANGKNNHDTITWNSNSKPKCLNHRYIGKRELCLCDVTNCPNPNIACSLRG